MSQKHFFSEVEEEKIKCLALVMSRRQLSLRFGVSRNVIERILNGKYRQTKKKKKPDAPPKTEEQLQAELATWQPILNKVFR